jgi:hypothetical protein
MLEIFYSACPSSWSLQKFILEKSLMNALNVGKLLGTKPMSFVTRKLTKRKDFITVASERKALPHS